MIISFIHSKVFIICVKEGPKLDLKNDPSLPFQATSHKKRSCAFPPSEKHLTPPCFEQRANRTGSLKKTSKTNAFPIERHGLEEGILQGSNFTADQVTIQREVKLNCPFTCSTSHHFLRIRYVHDCHRCGLSQN